MADGRGIDVPGYLSIAIGRRVASVIDREDGVHKLDAADIAAIEEGAKKPNGA